ncbi:MAG TPA: pyridoxal phosphate-dependent aminotransferase [Casimicrobiaceae bacterium]
MPDASAPLAPPLARAAVRALEASQIRAVANAGIGDPDVLAFWFGEPDAVTPEFIRAAAAESLARGETFYTQNFGLPELREAIARYVTELHGPVACERIAVTASGMSALMVAVQALVGAGDRVVAVTPLWPNLTEIPKVLGASVVTVPLRMAADGFTLDVDRLIDALTPRTRALLLNSPNNPTGWTIDARAQARIFAHCRRHGIWIIADDVYERLYYDDEAATAPSFLALAAPDDRLVSTNSFSKAWSMTGWRLGWTVAPPALMPELGKLIEYNTSCSPAFVQRAGVVALREGESTVAAFRARLRHARDRLVGALRALPGIDLVAPRGAMYAFFRVQGLTDSVAFCTRLVREAHLGLAPGRAFGPEGEGFVRWCFAADDARLDEGVSRLAGFVARDSGGSA